MVKYDAQVIVQFAADLYSQARSIPVTYAALGVLAGFGAGAAAFGTAIDGGGLIGGALGALLLGVVAFKLGQQKAFALKLQAQVALCQVQIETNTRGRVSGIPEQSA